MGARDAVLGAVFALHAVGGGDVKLMAALGSIAGPAAWLAIFIVTAMVGGAMALVLIAAKKRMRHAAERGGVPDGAPDQKEEELDVTGDRGLRLPHGLIIAVGTLIYPAYAFGCSISGGAAALR